MLLFRLLLCLVLGVSSFVHAQEPVEAPPSAAPVSPVGVAPLAVVHSTSERVEEFTSGLVQGLMTAERIPGLALVVVDRDRVMMRRSFGTAPAGDGPMTQESVFAVGGLRHVLIGLAAMQQIEAAKILAADDVARLLNDDGWRGVTIGELLTHEADDAPEALARIVARVAGQGIDAYVHARILVPLGMSHSQFEGGLFSTTASDMTRLLGALLNGGAFEGRRILEPATVELMLRTHRTRHQALPGWAYVFPEMRRGGWRALQYDGRAGAVDARLVLIPEDGKGYFLATTRNAAPGFWRVMDNSLFDRLVVPRDVGSADLRGAPPPSADLAHEVAGLYLAEPGIEADQVFLKTPRGRLRIDGRGDGALLLAGAETAELLARPGLYWRSPDGSLAGAFLDGQLLLGHTAYDRIRIWERPGLYVGLALLFGILATVILLAPGRIQAVTGASRRTLSYAGPALMAVCFLLMLMAVTLQRLALGP